MSTLCDIVPWIYRRWFRGETFRVRGILLKATRRSPDNLKTKGILPPALNPSS